MVMIDVGNPKMAREMLCLLQHQVNVTQMPSGAWHNANLQKMIDQLDIHRPLGSDDKHGNRHTETCGCDPEHKTYFYENNTVSIRVYKSSENEFVVADQGGWLPGVFETSKDALAYAKKENGVT